MNNKNSHSHSDNNYDEEIDLRELLIIVWQGKLIIIAITIFFALCSVFYALSLPNIYKSEVTLAPTDEAQGGGISKTAGLSGLASLAGVNLGAQSIDKVTIALEILRSRVFISEFVQKYNILPEVMATEKWDPSSGIIFNSEIYDASARKWIREVATPKRREPSKEEYVKVFKEEILEVIRDEATGLVTLVIRHQSPEFAKKVAEWLVKEINNTMRERDIKEARLSLEYLNRELMETSLSNMKQIFYELVEQQTQTIMLANVRPEYIFQTLDPAIVPQNKAEPARAILCIVGTMLGAFLGLIIVFLKSWLWHSELKN